MNTSINDLTTIANLTVFMRTEMGNGDVIFNDVSNSTYDVTETPAGMQYTYTVSLVTKLDDPARKLTVVVTHLNDGAIIMVHSIEGDDTVERFYNAAVHCIG